MVTRARDAASAHVAGGGGTTARDADVDAIVDDDARRRGGRRETTHGTTGDDARAPCGDGEDDAGGIAPRCARERDRARWTRAGAERTHNIYHTIRCPLLSVP